MNDINEILKSDIRASLTKSGLLLFLAGFFIFMGIITSELFYTADFSARDNYISELASKISMGTGDFRRISVSIFDYTMIAAGLMIMAGTWFVHKIFRKYLLTVPMAMFGAGLACSGILQGALPTNNILVSAVFVCGSMAATVSFKIVDTPLKYIFACFGVIVLIMLVFQQYFIPVLGVGGAERWLFYPVVFWVTGMGAYLLGIKDGHKNTLRA
ncbi:MAG: DUF998 domain-containing protein [Bacteroidales bacterium]|jgi:hypothetical membrane protein|nr:DUF998 domain-containing protein [Bacteroidales bacterium]